MKRFAIFLATSVVAFSQAPLQFDVASIRPSDPVRDSNVNVGLHMDGSQMRITGLLLREYVAMAYRVNNNRVDGPDWIGEERFDISAALPAGSKTADIPEMLASLLAERFQLKFHRTQKEFTVYALEQGKGPLAMKPSVVDAAAQAGAVDIAGAGSRDGVAVSLGGGASYTFAGNKFEAKRLTMANAANSLQIYMDRPVVDQTGLADPYDFSLELTPEDYRVMLIRAGVTQGVAIPPQALRLLDGATTPSLYEGLQKLGLKMEVKRVPLDVIVVDSMSKNPTEN